MFWNQYGSSIGKADAILRILSVSEQSDLIEFLRYKVVTKFYVCFKNY